MGDRARPDDHDATYRLTGNSDRSNLRRLAESGRAVRAWLSGGFATAGDADWYRSN
jgi:hypothetical protein